MNYTSEMSPADFAAISNGNGFGNGNDFWILILFFFLAGNGGWGNGWGGNGNGFVVSDVQSGFNQAAVIDGINTLNTAVSNGFANAEISRCNQQTNVLQTLNNATMATQLGFCNTNSNIADLKYTVATEACADRSAINDALQTVLSNVNAGVQSIKDQMCQDKIDAKNEEIAQLRTQLNLASLAASQGAQTAQILQDNANQTLALERYLNPTPIPAYTVPAPYSYGCNVGCGGCGV